MSDISKIKLPNGDVYNLKDSEALHQGDVTSGAIEGVTKQGDQIVIIADAANNYPLEELKVNFEPYQEGSGDPSPENVRPISGWDGCTVHRAGKNLFDASSVVRRNGYLINDAGQEQSTSSSGYTLSKTPVNPGNIYTLSGTIVKGTETYRIYFYNGSTFLSRTSTIPIWSHPYTFTVPSGCNCIALQYQLATVDFDTIQLEPGSTATPYEPYTATTYPITWQSAGTVYGGYVDLVRGVLVAEWSNIASYDGETLPGVWISDKDVYASGTTPTTGAQVAYQLATPITYPLTPTEIRTFSGVNNFWSNIGTISSITYAQDTKNFIQENSVRDVQVNGTSIVTDGVANVPLGTGNTPGVVRPYASYGTRMIGSKNDLLATSLATDSEAKAGTNQYKPIVPSNQHISAFYALAKAAGADEKDSTLPAGQYTNAAKAAIQHMIGTDAAIAPYEADVTADRSYAIGNTFMMDGKLYKATAAIAQNGVITPDSNCIEICIDQVYVKDVQVNGTSIKSNGIANVPEMSDTVAGVVKRGSGLYINSSGQLCSNIGGASTIKQGTASSAIAPISLQGNTVFYGLAKAAGTDMSSSSNAIGTYTDEAKAAIKSMLGVIDGSTGIVEVSGTTPTITAIENTRYVCDEVATLSFTPPSSGIAIVRFTSGTTPTVLTVPNTVIWPEWFDAATLEASRIYEMCITDGVYGAVMSWPL